MTEKDGPCAPCDLVSVVNQEDQPTRKTISLASRRQQPWPHRSSRWPQHAVEETLGRRESEEVVLDYRLKRMEESDRSSQLGLL